GPGEGDVRVPPPPVSGGGSVIPAARLWSRVAPKRRGAAGWWGVLRWLAGAHAVARPCHAVGDTPGRPAVRHGRGASPARGRAHRGPAPDDRADLACGGARPWRWPRRVRHGVALAGDVPPAGTGARQHGAPE